MLNGVDERLVRKHQFKLCGSDKIVRLGRDRQSFGSDNLLMTNFIVKNSRCLPIQMI